MSKKELNKKIKKLKVIYHPDTYYLIEISCAIPWPISFEEYQKQKQIISGQN